MQKETCVTIIETDNRIIELYGVEAQYPNNLFDKIPFMIIEKIKKKNGRDSKINIFSNNEKNRIFISTESLRGMYSPKAIVIGKIKFPEEIFKKIQVIFGTMIINTI